MTWELTWEMVIGFLATGIVGAVLTYLGTRGKTQSDHKTAMDRRIDEKMATYLEALEARLSGQDGTIAKLQDHITGQDGTIAKLQAHIAELMRDRTAADRREGLLVSYVDRLRNHIINELPPPPPDIPAELKERFVEARASP